MAQPCHGTAAVPWHHAMMAQLRQLLNHHGKMLCHPQACTLWQPRDFISKLRLSVLFSTVILA